jgi:hypothetical protein
MTTPPFQGVTSEMTNKITNQMADAFLNSRA